MKKIDLKETLSFERTFEVIKIDLYSSCVSHFSLEIFGFVSYVNNSAYITLRNDFWEIKYIFEIMPLNRSNVCWFSASGYTQMHSCKWICSTTSVIFLISQKVITQCDVCGGVIYISNKSKYLKTEMRYARAVKINHYSFKRSFKWKGFPSNLFFHLIYPLTGHNQYYYIDTHGIWAIVQFDWFLY